MENTRTQTSEHFAICDVLHSRYFKGYYDDGYLIDGYFVTEAVRATPFDSVDRANNTIDTLKDRDPLLSLSVVKVETVSKISFID
jgi:hypothetical protein